MKIGNLFKHLRLLPSVMVVGITLLGLKTTGLVMEARAQDAASAQPAAQPSTSTPSAEAGDATDDPEATSAQVDVLTSLSKRRAELDARERDLDMRANLIQAAENRVDGKIADLKQMQTQIQTLLQSHDAAQQKEIDSLTKTYSSMKPKDAARIFNNLNDDVLIAVAGQMKPDVLGAVLAAMQPDAAQKLTVKLADKLKLPDTASQAPAPQQVASVTPASATAAPATATPPSTPPATQTATSAPTPPPAAAPQAATSTPASASASKAAANAAPASAGGK